MALIAHFKPKGPNGLGFATTAERATAGLDLTGKNILVTGANSGLGAETARVLSMRGARVIATGRSFATAKRATEALKTPALPLACDLADPRSVAGCVAAVIDDGARLDAIVCNAGIMALPTLERAHGYELQFMTNHLGHFALVTGLLDRLTDEGRVVMLTSNAHRAAPPGGIDWDNLDGSRGYDGWSAYGRSKIANILFAKELARRFAGSKKLAHAVHPGVIKTNLARHMNIMVRAALAASELLFLKTVEQGAATQCYVAVHPDVAAFNGEYWNDCNPESPRADAKDEALARRLWDESERILAKIG